MNGYPGGTSEALYDSSCGSGTGASSCGSCSSGTVAINSEIALLELLVGAETDTIIVNAYYD